ncbi:MAG: hypothetical protein ABJK43_06380 [Lentilitoribacter sp.]
MTENIDPLKIELSLAIAKERNQGKPVLITTAKRIDDYARRNVDAPLDLELERILRNNEGVRNLYFQMKARQSIGFSEIAAAASSGGFPRRELAGFELNVAQDGEVVFVVLQRSNVNDKDLKMPNELEIRDENGKGGAVVLPDEVQGKQLIALSINEEKDMPLIAALKKVKTRLFLK